MIIICRLDIQYLPRPEIRDKEETGSRNEGNHWMFYLSVSSQQVSKIIGKYLGTLI